MKVLVNLAIPPETSERYTLAYAIPVSLVALVLLAYFVSGVAHNVASYQKYQRSLLDLAGEQARWNETEKTLQESLNRPQPKNTIRAVKFVNTLINKKQFSLRQLIAKVNKVLPPIVHLEGLSFSPEAKDPMVRFTVVGKTQEAMEAFLSNLEDSKDFSNVTILNQGLADQAAGGTESTLSCSALYVGEATEEEIGNEDASDVP
jgi:hypothetical protein